MATTPGSQPFWTGRVSRRKRVAAFLPISESVPSAIQNHPNMYYIILQRVLSKDLVQTCMGNFMKANE